MLSTAFTELVGCEAPIQQAGMGGVSTPALAAAVSRGGGLGMTTLSPAMMDDEATVRVLGELREETGGLFGVNLLIPYVDRRFVELVAPFPRVIDFFWGEPDAELVAAAHAHAPIVSWQVGSRREAEAAVAAGCDFVIAQGTEGGGHLRGKLGLLPLLGEVLPEVDVPVLGAGGIGTASALAAVLAAGAAGARIGTRFVATMESGAHPVYKQALIDASTEDAVHTNAYHVECGLCPSTHGVLRSALEAAERLEADVVGEWETPQGAREVPRYFGPPPTVRASGHIEAMALYAGQSVGGVHEIKPAAEVIRELVEGAEQLLAESALIAS